MTDVPTVRPFRFGVQIARMRSLADWIAAGQRAEALGYDVFLMPDHFGAQLGIMPALATIAAHTESIHLGTLVWQNDLRHPALLMKDIATLDVLSEGRFEIGIGAGGSFPPDFVWTGIPFDPPATRVARLEECVAVLKGLAAEGPFSFTGEYFTFDAYEAWPKPFQQPMTPLLIAAGGKRMLRLAAREADIVALLPAMKDGARRSATTSGWMTSRGKSPPSARWPVRGPDSWSSTSSCSNSWSRTTRRPRSPV